ncbi:TolB family protein [Gimesia algae]|uniref:Translocation protein TolB n=1 Tax=Gimesia algae TaxID=2527971 RepID=A0A517VLR3_9PLAN|nr:PD40 domain-containing protein [Gimesia algae]QDT93963.1 translocation protein TolB [Gimesia algae]
MSFFLHIVSCLFLGTLLFSGLSSMPATADERATEPARVRFYKIPAEGGDPALFLVPGEFDTAGSPAFSADGQKLLFDGWNSQAGETSIQAKIIMVNADGSDLKILGPGAMPSWSPGGNRIAFSQRAPYGVATMHADGSQRTLIDEGGWGAQWSPDGRKIAYSFPIKGRGNIRIYDLIEGTKTDLFPPGESPYTSVYWNMAWSPDSQWLCFKGCKASDRTFDVATINVAGKQAGFKVHYHHKTAPYADFAWHPVGEMIVFCPQTMPRQLLQFNPADDKPPEPVDVNFEATLKGDVSFTPDGGQLLFSLNPPIKTAN